MSRLSLKTLIFSLLLSFLFAGLVQAIEMTGKTKLSLKSSTEEVERFRDFGSGLSFSDWPDLAALGDLALSMTKAIDVGDAEGFVAARAVYNYRMENFSEEVKLEILRIQLGMQCENPRPVEKCGGGGGGCTSNFECVVDCGVSGSFCHVNGFCVCG